MTVVCGACGERNAASARFCQACGSRLGEAPPQLRKKITALFCDLAGSTALAESLGDPEAIHDVLTRYLRAMTTVIERHGGTVEKFAGDAILGTFGVPQSHEDDALRAVRAAIEMREALSSLNGELEARWGIALQIRIGINSGEALTGYSVAGQALALGDPMNVAARLEQTADPGDIVLGEATLRLAGPDVRVDTVRWLRVKGKSADVAAYRLVGLAPDVAASRRRFTRPLVGRTQELQLLRSAYARVVHDGTADFLVVVGSPGVGKSRLLAEFMAEMEDRATSYAARCPSYGERMTFWPLAEVVRARARILPSDDATAVDAKLVRAVSAVAPDRGERLWLAAQLASLIGTTPGDGRDADVAESFAAWRRFLERVASPRPLILAFEDLHWADDSFLDLVAYLAKSAARILLIGTARSDFDESRVVAAGATVLRLGSLGPDEVRALVEGLAEPSLPREMHREIVERAGGNPLFAEALVAMIAERGPTDTGVLEVPDTVEALVSARLDALPHPLRSLVLDAAVLGSSIRAEAIASMRGLDPGAVQTGIEDLVGREFLRPADAPNGYEFRHDLVRETAYGQIPRAARSATHRAFAEWLDEHSREGAAPDLLAHHYGRACDLAVEGREPPAVRGPLAERAFRYRVAAAGQALRGADPGSAAALLERAAEVLSEIAAPDLDEVGDAGRMLVALGRWEEVIRLLSGFADSDHSPILRELGVAICKLHRDDPRGADYRRGQSYLERAAAHRDPDATGSLAGTWKGIDDAKTLDLYRRASEMDPADPYPLGNLVECEIQQAGEIPPVEEMRDRISPAIERCRRQAAEGKNLPWAYYDLGKFHLLLGLPYESLHEYAKAVDLSPASFMVETSLASLLRMSTVADRIPGLAWPRDLLILARRAKFAAAEATDASIAPPVVVLAGGTALDELERTGAYGPLLVEAFRDFTGTVVSGGTAQGVSGLAGDLGERYPNAVHTIGYRPADVPASAVPDERYHEVRPTEGNSFGPAEPLAYWADLLRAGNSPSQVKMIGIGGGRVAAAEYAIALALGAGVGIIGGSGRAADELLSDPHWSSTTRLTPLPSDVEAIRSFLAGVG